MIGLGLSLPVAAVSGAMALVTPVASWRADTNSLSDLASLVTLTRSSSANRINSSGVLVSAASDTGRIDYTFSSRPGLLVETAFTNIALQTAFASGYTSTRATLTPAAATGIDGGTTAATLVEDSTAANTHSTRQSLTTVAGSTYTQSVVVKAKGRSWVALQYQAAQFGTLMIAYFDLANGVVGSCTAGATSRIRSLGNGRYRIWITATATVSTTAVWQIFLATADGTTSYDGDGASGVYLEFYNGGVGAYASSLLSGTTASVTRAADVLAAAAYSSNPAIVQYRSQATDVRARRRLSTFSSISAESGEWIEAFRIYPVGTPLAWLDAHLLVDGSW